MTEAEWIEANAPHAARALVSAQQELYALLGGLADPERERDVLAEEIGRLRVTWRPGT
jgi:hypothetical protein